MGLESKAGFQVPKVSNSANTGRWGSHLLSQQARSRRRNACRAHHPAPGTMPQKQAKKTTESSSTSCSDQKCLRNIGSPHWGHTEQEGLTIPAHSLEAEPLPLQRLIECALGLRSRLKCFSGSAFPLKICLVQRHTYQQEEEKTFSWPTVFW